MTGSAGLYLTGGGCNRNEPYLTAHGETSNERTIGRAAGLAFDPLVTDPGTDDYAHQIHAEFVPTSADDQLGVEFLARNSRFGSEPVWSLVIASEGFIAGLEDLTVQFNVHREALVDPLGDAPPVLFDLASSQPLDDQVLAASVLD